MVLFSSSSFGSFDCGDLDVIGDENVTAAMTELEGLSPEENTTAAEFCTDVFTNLVDKCENPDDCGYLLDDTYDDENTAVSNHRRGLKTSLVASTLTLLTLLMSQLVQLRLDN